MNAFDLAARQIGLNESDQKAALQEYLRNGGQNLDPAVTAWCAAFVDATLRQSGGQGTGKLTARSYLDWGQEVTEPQRGDIAVFSRGDPNGWQGHVGFFDGYNDDGSIRVLGGNQGNAVSITNYDANTLPGFRRGGAQPQLNSLAVAGSPEMHAGGRNALSAVGVAETPGKPAYEPLRLSGNYLNPEMFMSRRKFA